MWMQGESDAYVQELAPQYQELEKRLVNTVRSAFGSRDADNTIRFVDGAIAQYKPGINIWTHSDTINKAKTANCALWYVPVDTTGNVISKTTPGIYTSTSGAPLSDSIWVDTSTCISKLENNNENGENDGYHYSGDSMLKLGIWFGQAATYDFVS